MVPPQADRGPKHFGHDFIRPVLAVRDAKHVEALVQEGLRKLLDVEKSLKAYGGVEIASWLEQADRIRTQFHPKPTIVGVVGGTGAGKSSLINALLDESRLVPTSGMRACTAVVTEISWNSSLDPEKRYQGSVEFISVNEWKRELNIILPEILDEDNKISRFVGNADSDAGIAYAKINAVYPEFAEEEMAHKTVAELLNRSEVKDRLGSVVGFESQTANDLYGHLKKYVDSEEHGEKDLSKKRQIQWWPLVKSVKIKTKAEALSTGAILVDLPGVQDSNAARAAVAERYLKQCSALWIVAPIDRAVNNKAAKSLLGEQFKRQLKLDGMLSRVTFICSKTDDILVSETKEPLRLREQLAEVESQRDRAKRAKTAAEQNYIKSGNDLRSFEGQKSEVKLQLLLWTNFKRQLDAGLSVFEPEPEPKKRKRSRKAVRKPSKRIELDEDCGEELDELMDSGDDDDDEDEDEDKDGLSADENSDAAANDDLRKVLSKNDVQTKISELKAKLQAAEEDTITAKKERRSFLTQKQDLRLLIKASEHKMKAICIRARNEWSRGRIQNDFMMGIKELDQEHQNEEDPDNFNPAHDIRDYEEVARSFPVFCISSREYQSMSGRLKEDGGNGCFENLEQTEMPQLKQHCIKMTESNRLDVGQALLAQMTKLFMSLSLWSSNDGTGVSLGEEEEVSEQRFLSDNLKALEQAFTQACGSTSNGMKIHLEKYVRDFLEKANAAGRHGAVPTSLRWEEYKWNEYKAIMRRHGGPYTNATGYKNLNEQLGEPFLRFIATNWECCFKNHMPRVLETFGTAVLAAMKAFHVSVGSRSQSRAFDYAGFFLLGHKLSVWEATPNTMAGALHQLVLVSQKEATRITPAIRLHMIPVYDTCAAESGLGCYKRIKSLMNEYLIEKASIIFSGITKCLDGRLDSMIVEAEETMKKITGEVFDEISRDFTVSKTRFQPGGLPSSEAERQLRASICQIVREADANIRKLLEPGWELLSSNAQVQQEIMIIKNEEVV